MRTLVLQTLPRAVAHLVNGATLRCVSGDVERRAGRQHLPQVRRMSLGWGGGCASGRGGTSGAPSGIRDLDTQSRKNVCRTR